MSFWKKILGLEDDNEQSQDLQSSQGGKNSELNTTFVTSSEEDDFANSIYGQLELLESDLEHITEVLPERGDNLKVQITLIRQLLLQTNNEADVDVQKVFHELKEQFEEDRRFADGEYTIRELESQTRSMDRMFETTTRDGKGITKEKLDEYIDYIQKIQNKIAKSDNSDKPLLVNVRRQRFNEVSLKAEYRIKMLELMYLLDNGDVDTNPFKNLSASKQKIFSKYFMDDARVASAQYTVLSMSEEIFKMGNPYLYSSIESTADRLNDQLGNASMIEDFSIRQLFDSRNPSAESFNFLKDFIRFKTNINLLRDKQADYQKAYDEKKAADENRKKEAEEKAAEAEKQKQTQAEQARQAEQKRKEEEKKNFERYKNMSDSEIRKEIYKIEHDLTATGSRYVNIIDFQRTVARAKGLLDSVDEVQNDLLTYKSLNALQAWNFIQKANALGVNYSIFPDAQEHSNGGFLVAISKSDKKVLDVEETMLPFVDKSRGYYNYCTDATFGTFPLLVLDLLKKSLPEDGEYNENLFVENPKGDLYTLVYAHRSGYTAPGIINRKKLVYENLINIRDNILPDIGSDQKELKDVLCYISFPANRNMIPILEEFKKAEVTPFLEPVPDTKRNGKNRDNIHIYFRREDLEKFEEIIMPQISNSKIGIVDINWDTTSFGDSMSRVSKWPKAKDFEDR